MTRDTRWRRRRAARPGIRRDGSRHRATSPDEQHRHPHPRHATPRPRAASTPDLIQIDLRGPSGSRVPWCFTGVRHLTDSIAMWRAEHANFARLLDLLEEQLAAFFGGDEPEYALMLNIVSYLQEFPDRVHHPHEDAVFERLVARDAELRIPINRLLQEHRVIAIAGEELSTRLNEIVAGEVVLRSSVEAAAATYLAYYRHHLATEESEILPRAARLLEPADWRDVARAVAHPVDPLFGNPPEERFVDLRVRVDALHRRSAPP